MTKEERLFNFYTYQIGYTPNQKVEVKTKIVDILKERHVILSGRKIVLDRIITKCWHTAKGTVQPHWVTARIIQFDGNVYCYTDVSELKLFYFYEGLRRDYCLFVESDWKGQ